eukprot:jgi/Tetstr1/434374/TSEL_023475.t1
MAMAIFSSASAQSIRVSYRAQPDTGRATVARPLPAARCSTSAARLRSAQSATARWSVAGGSGFASRAPAARSRGVVAAASNGASTFPDLKIAVYSTKPYVRESFQPLVEEHFPSAVFYEPTLSVNTVNLSKGAEVVVLFVNDVADAEVISGLAANGVKHIAMRCAGFDKVDVDAAAKHGITVSRVPSYSPISIAEHALSLLMTLNKKLHRVPNRLREGNFTLSGLQGYEISGKTIGVVGTGRIGKAFCRIMRLGFGCRVLAYDMYPADDMKELGVEYMDLQEMLPECHAVGVFAPLNESTYHLINEDSIKTMKEGAFLINVSRGGLVDTGALLKALKEGRLGAAGLDVYENEASLFFEDFSTAGRFNTSGWDGQFVELEALPNVLISPHTAFLTYEALSNITATVVDNISEFAAGKPLTNWVKPSDTVVNSISEDLPENLKQASSA